MCQTRDTSGARRTGEVHRTVGTSACCGNPPARGARNKRAAGFVAVLNGCAPPECPQARAHCTTGACARFCHARHCSGGRCAEQSDKRCQ